MEQIWDQLYRSDLVWFGGLMTDEYNVFLFRYSICFSLGLGFSSFLLWLDGWWEMVRGASEAGAEWVVQFVKYL